MEKVSIPTGLPHLKTAQPGVHWSDMKRLTAMYRRHTARGSLNILRTKMEWTLYAVQQRKTRR